MAEAALVLAGLAFLIACLALTSVAMIRLDRRSSSSRTSTAVTPEPDAESGRGRTWPFGP